jgi:hypothetical protein
MLFYTAIFLVCLVAGLLLPLLFRVLSGVGNVVEQTACPLSKIQSTSHLSPHAKRAIKRDPWASQLALANTNHAIARQDMGGGGSYYDPRKEYSVPHQAKMLLKRTDRISRGERRVVETATYKVSREIRVAQNDSKSAGKPVMVS